MLRFMFALGFSHDLSAARAKHFLITNYLCSVHWGGRGDYPLHSIDTIRIRQFETNQVLGDI